MTIQPTMADHRGQDGSKQKQRRSLAAAVLLLSLAGLFAGLVILTLLGSLAGLAAASPPLLLLSPVLVPAALLGVVLATGAAASAALALGALSILSRLFRKAAASLISRDDEEEERVRVEDGKRRVGELGAVAAQKTPHAALAVVSPGQGVTDHKKAKDYQHYVAGRMVQDDA